GNPPKEYAPFPALVDVVRTTPDWSASTSAPATAEPPVARVTEPAIVPAFSTVNVSALLVPPAVVTVRGPVAEPDGTVTVMLLSLHPLGATVAVTLLKNLTVLLPCVAPKYVPEIVTVCPMTPFIGNADWMLGANGVTAGVVA